jgi:xanthine/CO dehydrogenase XdhC/CoxF family maturation factor
VALSHEYPDETLPRVPLERLNAPVPLRDPNIDDPGLAIGAKSPEEITHSAAAQLTERLRGADQS